MTLTHLGNNVYYTDTIGERPTGITAQAVLLELPSRRTYNYDGTSWITPEAFIDGYSWLIYKSGSNYKGKSGYSGYVPSGAISTSMDTVWSFIRSNFEQSGEETSRGGLIQFHKGTFTFTDRALIDETFIGAANDKGIIIQGHKAGTRINFAPTTSKDSGFKVIGLTDQVIRDLDIQINTNVTNAIYVDAVTTDTPRGLYENIRVFPSNSQVNAGQRALYIHSINPAITHQTNVNNFNAWWFETAIETGVTNTSLMTFNQIHMWLCKRGIKIGNDCSNHQVDNVTFVDESPFNAEYAVSVGQLASNCSINKVTCTGLSGATATDVRRVAAVLVQEGAFGNKVSNVSNPAGNAVLDISGNMTNEINNIDLGAGRPNEFKQIESRWSGFLNVVNDVNIANGTNYFLDLQGIGNYANATQVKDANDGLGRAFVTTAVANNQSGFRTTSTIMQARWLPKLWCRFKLSHTNNQRIWILFTSSSAAPPLNNTYTNDISVFGLAVNDVASNFQVIRNDATGAATYSNMVQDDGVTIIPIDLTYRNDTLNAHELVIMAERGGDWYIGLDRYKAQRFATEVPALATNLGLTIVEETTGAATRTLQLFDIKLNSIK